LVNARLGDAALFDEAETGSGNLAGFHFSHVHTVAVVNRRAERRPPHVSAAAAPGDPGGGPGLTGHPHPAVARIFEPAPVVISGIAPWFLAGPGEAVVGVDPVPNSVRTPRTIDALGAPASAVV